MDDRNSSSICVGGAPLPLNPLQQLMMISFELEVQTSKGMGEKAILDQSFGFVHTLSQLHRLLGVNRCLLLQFILLCLHVCGHHWNLENRTKCSQHIQSSCWFMLSQQSHCISYYVCKREIVSIAIWTVLLRFGTDF